MITKKGRHSSAVKKKFRFNIIPPVILLALCASCTPSKEFLLKHRGAIAGEGPYIRVLIKTTNSRIAVSSVSNIKITNIKTRKIEYDGKGKELLFHPENIKHPVLIETSGTALSVDRNGYRGMIELHNNLGNLYIINVVKMNEYLYGVVPSEIPSLWHIEAVKAQAVAARTYTYYHLMNKKKSLFDLDATTSFQVYSGISAENANSTGAVDETSGDIMVYENKPILAFFHSTCGGRTMNDKHIWNGDDKPYLEPVKCGYCGESPYFKWEEKVSLYEIRNSLKKKYKGIGQISGINLLREGTRVASVIIHHRNGVIKLTGNEFRLLFTDNKIKSMFFTSKKIPDGLLLLGNGWGHGVGMCQWGAKGMAEKGADYIDILKYYYRGIRIINTGRNDYAAR